MLDATMTSSHIWLKVSLVGLVLSRNAEERLSYFKKIPSLSKITEYAGLMTPRSLVQIEIMKDSVKDPINSAKILLVDSLQIWSTLKRCPLLMNGNTLAVSKRNLTGIYQ
jgi:hypothetical protein